MTEVVVHAQTLASERALLLELRAAGGGPLPTADAGAHIDLHLPGGLTRQYSLLDTGRSDRYLICVQHELESRGGSRHVHRQLRVGDLLQVSEPRNTFALDAGPRHAVLLAGGIGVTPLLGMAAALDRAGRSFELHCYSRGVMPLREYIEAQPFAGRVAFHDSGSGDSFRDSPPPLDSAAVVYACGPGGFLEAVAMRAAASGVASEAVHSERFLLDEPVDISGDAFLVVAASTGERMAVTEDETIAEVLERHGYEVALSCEQGICGSCITGVLAGIPDHRDEVQTPSEHAANTLINVCVSRSKSAELTLDI
jgi:vanillate O-demethylase ferredoxin subunit